MGVCSIDDSKKKIKDIKDSKNSKNSSTNPKVVENSQDETIKNKDLKVSKNLSTNSNIVKNSQPEASIKNKNKNKDGGNIKIDLYTTTVIKTPKDIEIKKPSINYELIGGNEGQNEEPNENKDSNLQFQENAKNDSSKYSGKELDNNINNSKNENLSNNYKNLENNEKYYLICPYCNLFITKFENAEYDSDKKDIKIKYKCSCEESKEKFLYSIIKEEKPKCREHNNNEINFICEDCSKQICQECKSKKHDSHQVKNVINNEVISDSINNIISEQKSNFKGFDVFSKLFEYYNKDKKIKEISEKLQEIENPNESQKNSRDELKIDNNDKVSDKIIENKKNIINHKSIIDGNINEVINSIVNGNNIEKMQEQLDEINIKKDKDFEKQNLDIKFDAKNKEDDKINDIKFPAENEINKINNIEKIITDKNPKLDEEKSQVSPPNDFKEQEKENEEKILTNDGVEDKDLKYNSGNKEINNEQSLLKEGKKDPNDINYFKVNDNKTNNEINSGINNKNKNNVNDEIAKNIKNEEANLLDDKIKEINNNSKIKDDNIVEDGIGKEKIGEINKEKNNIIEDNKHNKNINKNNKKINYKLPKVNHNHSNENIIKPIKNYKNIKTLIGHKNRIVSLIRLTLGYIATGSYDYSIKIWDITKEPKDSLVAVKYSDSYIFCLLELKPNELLAGNGKNAIDIFDLNDNSNNFNKRLCEHKLWISSLIKCDENNFASASNDTRIIIWDSNTKIKLRELLGHTNCILTMILLEDGKLCSGGADNKIIIWDWKNQKYLYKFKANNSRVKVIYQFNEQILLTGSDDKEIKIWDINNLEQIDELKGHQDSVRTFCKIDDNHFASGSFDNTIKIWDFNEKKCINDLEGHQSKVICIIKYDDKLISCSNDATIKIWE